MSADGRAPAGPIALTVDIHAEDRPADISRTASWLHEHSIPATFFVPSALFEDARLPAARRPPAFPGLRSGQPRSQSRFHRNPRADAGPAADLGFLRRSHALYQETFGNAPVSFRSPAWCPLGPSAIDGLVSLGYRVDSSATPQRLPIFSSTPYANTWIGARRGIHELAPGLFEIPTSCLLLPAASPAFLTLRRRAALAFLRLLLWDARRRADRIPCVQFHVSDFVHDAASPTPEERLGLGSFLPKRDGGLRFKVFLRERDPQRVYTITQEVVETLRCQSDGRFVRLRELVR